MEQEIRFCSSADGTRIAYATYGADEERTLFFSQAFETSQELFPGKDALYEGLGVGRNLITFDSRGVGGSQREVSDLTMTAQVADVAAVVDQLGLENFDLMGWAHGGALAAAYAAEHPEQVDKLVLWHPHIRTLDSALRGFQDLAQSIRANWSLARRSWAAIAFPNGPTEAQRLYSNMLRDSVAPEIAARHLEVIAEFDGKEILPKVKAQTLVLAMSAFRDSVAPVRSVASLIADARFQALEGDWGAAGEDPSQALAAIRNFLDQADAESEAVESQPVPGGLLTILFTDMESSTSIARLFGDRRAQEVRGTHNTIVRTALSENGGSEVKHTGDGIMASFATASAALECAIAIQRGVAQHHAEHQDSPLGVYIGLNAGEPIAEDDDLFGTSVDLARRICDHAEPGQILASNVVRELAAGKDFLLAGMGEVVPKGFEEPVRLYEVRWREAE